MTDKDGSARATPASTAGWAECCAPLVDKCALLLRLSPLCGVLSETDEAAALRSPIARQQSSERRALSVYRKMWKQSLGSCRFKSAIDQVVLSVAGVNCVWLTLARVSVTGSMLYQVSEFLKASVTAPEVMQAWSSRVHKAEQVQAGQNRRFRGCCQCKRGVMRMTQSRLDREMLTAQRCWPGLRVLVELLSLPPLGTLRDDTLATMVSAFKAERHYLKGLEGTDAEEGVRASFRSLVHILVGVLGERPASAASTASSADALVMALDQRDFRELWATGIAERVTTFWEDPGHVCRDVGVKWCIARLTQSLVLQQALHAAQMEAADSRRALSMVLAAVKWLSRDGVNTEGPKPRTLKLRGRLVDGEREAKLSLNLVLHEQPLSCLVVVGGDAERQELDGGADAHGEEYRVNGMCQQVSCMVFLFSFAKQVYTSAGRSFHTET